MYLKKHTGSDPLDAMKDLSLPTVTSPDLHKLVAGKGDRCIIIIDYAIVDVTEYLDEHVSVFSSQENEATHLASTARGRGYSTQIHGSYSRGTM